MGKLRTALTSVVNNMFETQKFFDELSEELKSLTEETAHVIEYIKNGTDVLLMDLQMKFKKEGSTLKQNEKKQLKEVTDSGLEKDIKTINDATNTMQRKYEKGAAACSDTFAKIRAVHQESAKLARAASTLVESKKKALVISKEKKEKYQHFLELVQWIEEEIDSQEAKITKVSKDFRNTTGRAATWAKKNGSIDGSWTVDDVATNAERAVQDALAEISSGNQEILEQVHKQRDEVKKIGPQIKKLQAMAKEADEFEKAS